MLIRTLATGAAVAGGSALAACAQQGGAAQIAEPGPPETTTVRIVKPAACDPGIWLAKDLLLEEGFTDVRFVATPFISRQWITENLADVSLAHTEFVTGAIDSGLPIVVLTGLHAGCLELWVGQGISNVHDLRGRRISVCYKGIEDQFFTFFAVLLQYVGIDPLKDVHFVESGLGKHDDMVKAFVEGRADAVIAGAAQGPLLRRLSRAPGRVILETMQKPWSQYFCCNFVANRDWAQRNPNATKRVTRAILKATDRAAKDKPRSAHDAAATGIGVEESIVAETIAMCTYNWRDADPGDTLRFFGLRLADAKLIKSTPQQLIDQGTDLAYMRQLRGELKS